MDYNIVFSREHKNIRNIFICHKNPVKREEISNYYKKLLMHDYKIDKDNIINYTKNMSDATRNTNIQKMSDNWGKSETLLIIIKSFTEYDLKEDRLFWKLRNCTSYNLCFIIESDTYLCGGPKVRVQIDLSVYGIDQEFTPTKKEVRLMHETHFGCFKTFKDFTDALGIKDSTFTKDIK